MKKIIGILGVAVIAMAMFFNTNAINSSNGDLDLASLISMSNANAEIVCGNGQYDPGTNTVTYDCYNTACVCKNGVCSEANWISFRTECGSTQVGETNSDENCAAQSGASGC